MREFVIQCGSGQCIRGKNRSVHTVNRWLLERLISTPCDILWGKARRTRPRLRSHHRHTRRIWSLCANTAAPARMQVC